MLIASVTAEGEGTSIAELTSQIASVVSITGKLLFAIAAGLFAIGLAPTP